MKRSAGVTVIAVLSLLGSLFTCAMGVLVAAVAWIAPASGPFQQLSPGAFRVFMLAASLVYFLPGIWGIVTAIGLWRLRNWARISTIVFSALLIMMGFFSALVTIIVPFPPGPNGAGNPSIIAGVRIGMGAFWLTLLGIGIWWLVFFTRASVKEQFGELRFATATGWVPQPPYPILGTGAEVAGNAAAKRPVSITIIACFLLVGAAFMPLGLVLRAPAILFTKLLTGWPAASVFLVFAAAQIWIGVGLLRLKPAARTWAIAYLVFGAVNSTVFYLAPGVHGRMQSLMESERAMFPWMRDLPGQANFQPDMMPFAVMGAIAGLVVVAIMLYFLVTRKTAFEAAAGLRWAK